MKNASRSSKPRNRDACAGFSTDMKAWAAWGMGLALVAGAWLGAQQAGTAGSAAGTQPLEGQARVVHALQRLTWGIEPGEVEAVEKMGLEAWIEQQLHPESIPESPELTAALEPLDSLRMTPAEEIEHYPPGAVIQQMALGKRPLPNDPKLRAVVEWEIERLRAQQAAKKAGEAAPAEPPRLKLADDASGADAPPLDQLLTPEQIQTMEQGNPRDRVAELESLPQEKRDLVLASLPPATARQLEPWVPLDQAHQLAYNNNPQMVTSLDLLGAKVLRAVYSNRQLEDVLTDFWFNHFNVNIRKGPDREYVTAYERDVIRPHVLGKFRDLLLATAESPAMLYYLDNWQSVDPNAAVRRRNPNAARMGLNENYGRELMELHTIGLNYTQKDVTEVARCFTGWGIFQPQQAALFRYNDALHDKGAKQVLGVKIPAGGGMSDGLKVLDILSRSPLTAHHISYELAQRFVADDPPPALVDRMAAAYLRSDGDLRKVMEAMLQAPEFWEQQYAGNKVKSPLELVVSGVRAMGADVSNPTRLTQLIAQMGEPLYADEPPTGYPNTGAEWASSGGLVARMNFGLRLAADQIPGVQADAEALVPAAVEAQGPQAVAQSLFTTLLAGQASAPTRAAVEPAGTATGPQAGAGVAKMVGLILGSPDFQRR